MNTVLTELELAQYAAAPNFEKVALSRCWKARGLDVSGLEVPKKKGPAKALRLAPMTEAEALERFPCVHRGTEAIGHHICKPCQGGREHDIFWCSRFQKGCTARASGAKHNGTSVFVCLSCEDREESPGSSRNGLSEGVSDSLAVSLGDVPRATVGGGGVDPEVGGVHDDLARDKDHQPDHYENAAMRNDIDNVVHDPEHVETLAAEAAPTDTTNAETESMDHRNPEPPEAAIPPAVLLPPGAADNEVMGNG